MQYEEKYFEFGHDKLRYFQAGSGNAILFLQGWGVKALTYKKILDLLSKEYLVIAPDLPCFGESIFPNNIHEYFKILKRFLASLKFEKIAIIGHSLGGYTALQISAEIKNRSLLVLTDSAGISMKISTPKFLYKVFIEKTIRDIFLYRNMSVLLQISKDFFENLFKRFFQWKYTINIIKNILLNDFSNFDKINAKTLILWGEKDEIFPKNIAELFHQKIKNSELKIVKGNHDWLIFNPERFSNIVIDWLKRNSY